MKKITRIAGVTLAATFLLTACSSYDREEFISDLQTEQGLDEPMATCIADGAEEGIGVERLGSRGSMTTEEEEILVEVMTDCLLGG